MHTTRRLRVVAVLVFLTASVAMGASLLALLTLEDRERAAVSFEHALSRAVGEYRERVGLLQAKKQAEETIAETQPLVRSLTEEKRGLRHRIVRHRSNVATVERRYGLDLNDQDGARSVLQEERERFAEFLRGPYSDHAAAPSGGLADTLLEPLGERLQRGRGLEAVREAHMRAVAELEAGLRSSAELPSLLARREEVLTAFADVRHRHAAASETLALVDAEMQEIQQVLADVHEQVLRLQAELERIDARLQRRAERALIEKGLLPPKVRAGESGRPVTLTPRFAWPTYGRISAGFHDAPYEEFFGVPHEGIDIAVSEGTPVSAAADGIVFIVRDGGERGYTYALIGHQSGYATLYGHLQTVTVHAGQEVSIGQLLGMSGGRPGTPGAGPLTSGPHLHFEVIQQGVNIDPATVLP